MSVHWRCGGPYRHSSFPPRRSSDLIGMLVIAEVTEAVAEAIDRYELPNVVVDPVMVAKSGDRLLAQSATEALRTALLPRADLKIGRAHVCTPVTWAARMPTCAWKKT